MTYRPGLMKFALRQTAIATMLLSALLAGCAPIVVQGGASSCSDLLPTDWRAGVAPVALPEPASLPDGHDDARPWQEAFIGQTGQLDKANGRTADAIGIVERCERRDAEAARRASRKWWQIWK